MSRLTEDLSWAVAVALVTAAVVFGLYALATLVEIRDETRRVRQAVERAWPSNEQIEAQEERANPSR